MAELSSDTNILRLRLNQFLRKKLIYSGNFQAGFKCYKGRVCSWHTWIVDLFSKIKNKYTSAKLWPTPYSYLKTQENGLPTDCRCLLSRCMFCQHFSTNFWSISLVSKAMLYGEMKRGLYNEAKSLIYIMKIFWEKKIKTRKTCFQNRDCYLQNKWRALWSPSTTGTQQDCWDRLVSEQQCSETQARPEHGREQELEVGERRHLISKDFVLHEVIISLLK